MDHKKLITRALAKKMLTDKLGLRRDDIEAQKLPYEGKRC